MTSSNQQGRSKLSRRSFLKESSAGAAALTTVPLSLALPVEGSDEIRVGVVGCGGRGTGAALNVLQAKTRVIYPPPRHGYHTENAVPGARPAAKGVRIVALADLFEDRLEECRTQLRNVGVDIPKKRCFLGFDACQDLLALSDVNYVILASPPQFRPREMRAAIEAGKNVFMEKPIAVDAPGVRSVLTSGEMASAKGLGVLAGTVLRHEVDREETIKRLRNGAIGEITEARAYFNVGNIWMIPRKPGWADTEWHLRNWPYFTYLSGDIIVEQHIHTLDTVNWIMNDHPISAYGVGGRQALEGDDFGHTYDHFFLEFEYPNGTRCFSMNRQMEGCENRNGAVVVGTRGSSNCQNRIRGEQNWRFEGEVRDPYEQEQIDFIASIRAGSPLNETKAVAESTLTAIMGREAAYSGHVITWNQVQDSKRDYSLTDYHFKEMAMPEVVVPATYRFE